MVRSHIIFPFRDGPWGGCNQFLCALRNELRSRESWVDSPFDAEVILFDSINVPWEVMKCKRKLPGTAFVQRIDGPISCYRGDGKRVDGLVYDLGVAVADAVVFQSKYSRARNLALGMPLPKRWALVANAPRRDIFYPVTMHAPAGRLRIVSTSWSSNLNKGFDVYRYLDKHLDFSKYEMTFIGNSPISFRNITNLPPMGSAQLADSLRSHDVFLTASRDDPCSNALIEALACGLPAVALRSGGHPELVGRGGEMFDDADGVLNAIDCLAKDYDRYRERVQVRSIESVADDYLRLFELVVAAKERKSLSLPTALALAIDIAAYRFQQSLMRRLDGISLKAK